MPTELPEMPAVPLNWTSTSGISKLHNFARRLQHHLLFLCFLSTGLAAGQAVPQGLFGQLKWRLIGPFRAGRSVAVAGVPGDSTTFYFGGVDGGVWKTTDAGVVWTPIFDSVPVGSIGAIAVAPSDPQIIYVGTGESDIRSDLASGDGVYKSADAGRTWKHVGLEDTRQISRIVVDSQNANIVYVGALGHAYGPNPQRGLFKSVDGGAHWSRVLDLGPETGISDLAISARHPEILFAGAWHTKRPPWVTYAPIDGPGSGLYRSLDGGSSWSRITGGGLPAGDWGRVGVAVSSDGKRVYALIAAKQPGLYRSDDGGDTWTLANGDARLTGRAWYFNSVTIDPNNADVLYVPNVALYRSEDGGRTISIVRGAPGGDDYHQIWVDPKNSSRMVLGTDQGTTISLDRGKTWSTWYNQPTAQLYHVITDNEFPYVVYGPQQDSGSAAVYSRTDHGQITPRDWFPSGPSESGYMAPDPSDSGIVYVSGAYGTVDRFDRRTGLSQDVSPWSAPVFGTEINQRKYRAPWAPVLVFSPADPKSLFFGTQYVMKTRDGGLHWETISPDLTGTVKLPGSKKPEGAPTIENAEAAGYGVVFTIAPSALNHDLIWAGSDTGLIHLTRDGGRSWKNVTPKELGAWSKISLIEASRFDAGTAYAAVDRHRLDDQTPYLYRTHDYGASWQLATNGIASSCFLRAIREDLRIKGLLFAGTECGVYVSFDDGNHWQSLQLNLPVSSVRDLTVHGDDLVIATHGRSFWILDDMTPLRQVAESEKAGKGWLYRPATTIRVDNDDFPGTPLPPEEPTAENPPDGAILDYVLKKPANKVTLEIFDAQRELVRKFSSDDHVVTRHVPLPVAERWFPKPEVLETSPGMHRFVWDLTWRNSGGPTADEEAAFRNPRGPKVVPGLYQVRLTVDGEAHNQVLQVVMDPRSAATSQMLSQQLQTGRQMFAETLEARRTLAEINSVQKQLSDAQQKLGARSASLKSALGEAQTALGKILNDENAPGGPGLQAAYMGVAAALQVVETGDRTVPSQAVALYQESDVQIKARNAEWVAFKQTQLPQLNRQLQEEKLAPVAISEIEQEVEYLMTR